MKPGADALLPRAFFQRDVVEVAKDLIGRHVARDDVVLRITECEAYCGPTDTAAHSRAGLTPRTAPMFGPAGHAYVYLCYGIHWMLNLVAGGNGEGTAVLVRSCEVVAGADTVVARRGRPAGVDLVAGPGKVGQALGLDASFNRHDVCAPGGLELRVGEGGSPLLKGPRVGIGYASAKDQRAALRFALRGSAAVTSRKSLTAR